MDGTGPVEVKQVPVSPVLRSYLLRSGSPPDPVVSSLRARTAELGVAAGMMIPAEQAALLTLLARLLAARTVVDLGTFTGLSALSLARGLAPGGRVITCDNSDHWAEIAREHWTRAGVAGRIDFRLGPARRMLESLPADLDVDLVFVDADKLSYPGYCRLAIPLLRPGGLLVVDNVLLDGFVLAPELAGQPLLRRCAETLRELNAALAADERLETVMLPLADGLTLARKR